jgi:cytochrome P450
VLFGSTPKSTKDITDEDKNLSFDTWFHRRLNFLLKHEQFNRKLPILISDTKEALEAIKNEVSGRTNPFESLYRIVFRLTIRMVGPTEIAEDPKKLEDAMKMFEMIDRSATATSVIFPKLPSPAIIQRTYAGARLYMMIDKIIKKRAASDEKHDDALQHMLDQGDRAVRIVEFIIGALFAGLLNSGINAGWVSESRSMSSISSYGS